jgi:hypothetical protein
MAGKLLQMAQRDYFLLSGPGRCFQLSVCVRIFWAGTLSADGATAERFGLDEDSLNGGLNRPDPMF